jgi:hypothetical protein
LDRLGAAARSGQSLVVRQALVGADYGLLDEVTFDPRPDYYISLLWKKLMGRAVLEARADGASDFMRLYAHCGRAPGSIVLLALNVHPSRAMKIAIESMAPGSKRYELTAPALTSREVLLNGHTLSDRDGASAALRGRPIDAREAVHTLAPASMSFFELLGQDARACAGRAGAPLGQRAGRARNIRHRADTRATRGCA